MQRCLGVLLFVLTLSASASAQDALTDQQKIADLNQIAATLDKYYGPYEWKRDVIGFDLLRLTPWLQRIRHTDDLDFQDALIDYVASLNDAHSTITFPSNFEAFLGFGADVYDGTVVIDFIDRASVPAAQYPFAVGDEIVAFDDRPVWDVIASLQKYSIAANSRSTNRIATDLLTYRPQNFVPHAADLGATARVTIKSRTTGVLTTYVIPWQKSGTALTSQGPVPSPRRGNGRISDTVGVVTTTSGSVQAPFHAEPRGPHDDTLDAYLRPLEPLLTSILPDRPVGVLNFGSRFPVYAPPPGFVQRLGASSADFFLSGTFPASGKRIGLIRIPTFAPTSSSTALRQLDTEIAFMNANADALVIDVMRNPGGSLAYMEAIAQRIMPQPFQTVGFELRATARWIAAFDESLVNAQQAGAPAAIVANFQRDVDAILAAFRENRARTVPLPLNATGSLTVTPVSFAYRKPLMVLTDELSASAAETFAAIVQDNHRGPLFGMRTMGAGGNVESFLGASFTEGFISLAESLANRGHIIATPDYPAAPYIENIGVRPDIPYDFMTRTNLLGGGVPFTTAFVNTIVQVASQP